MKDKEGMADKACVSHRVTDLAGFCDTSGRLLDKEHKPITQGCYQPPVGLPQFTAS